MRVIRNENEVKRSTLPQVRGMEIEVRSMKGNEKRQCQSRANQCRADLKSLRKSIEQVLCIHGVRDLLLPRVLLGCVTTSTHSS